MADIGLDEPPVRAFRSAGKFAVSSTPHDTSREARDLRRYSNLVAQHARDRDDEMLDCTDPARFAVVIKTLFELSMHRISVFSDHICRHSFVKGDDGKPIPSDPYWSNPDVVEAAKNFVAREDSLLELMAGKQLDAAACEGLSGNEFVSGVITSPTRKGAVVLYLSKNGYAGENILSDINFVVNDDNGYRVEKPHTDTPALARFGRPQTNRDLFSAFDVMADHFDAAVGAGNTSCIKIAYDSDAKNIDKPTLIAPFSTYSEAVIRPFLIDQVNCPPNLVASPKPRAATKPPQP